MFETTKAIVLSFFKYGDSSLIVKCYTEKFGYKSFILKNSFSKKNRKSHFIFLFNEIEITFYIKKNNSLKLIKEIHQAHIFATIHTNIIKSSIITFIGEIINQILVNEEAQDRYLYNFIKNSLIDLDIKENYYSDFHLYFLLHFSKYIGFYPLENNLEFPYFNIKEGIFSLNADTISREENAHLWKLLLTYDFKSLKNCFNSSQRKQMLSEILTYFEMHLANFKKPISLNILKLIFD
jgi:DNA repair protein RecO (recombination protein O)